ncbi:hypothetical protein DERF_004415 [Dermatophagoides farinae]|uniref:Uncharacterized protein n=1 Tax=Dermatophagoides farinae TaxID=6954 RepID=A0A922I621_DERFA|nr:hypothetical protein DERF_004415 [Dermatophagoides farinae]
MHTVYVSVLETTKTCINKEKKKNKRVYIIYMCTLYNSKMLEFCDHVDDDDDDDDDRTINN